MLLRYRASALEPCEHSVSALEGDGRCELYDAHSTLPALPALSYPCRRDRPITPRSHSPHLRSNSTVGRCNIGVDRTFSGYFDDEEWWGLAWLKAYDLTQNATYLRRSQAVFDDLATRSWSDTSCGGGVCWQASKDPKDMFNCYKVSDGEGGDRGHCSNVCSRAYDVCVCHVSVLRLALHS